MPLKLTRRVSLRLPIGPPSAEAGEAVRPAVAASVATRTTNQRRMPGMIAQTETCYSGFRRSGRPGAHAADPLDPDAREQPFRRIGRWEVLVGAQHHLGQLLEKRGRAALLDAGRSGDRQVGR